MRKLSRITSENLILCEGLHDREFFTHLISTRNLPVFQVESLNYVLGSSHGGNTLFDVALDALAALAGFSKLKNIILVADNDENPSLEFSKLVDSINRTADILGQPNHRYLAPLNPKTKSQSLPAITILMMPDTGVQGSLDKMCFKSAENRYPQTAQCVHSFVECVGISSWSQNKLDKLKLRSLVSSTWAANPGLSVAYVWSEGTNIVPLDDPIFDDVANFLRNF